MAWRATRPSPEVYFQLGERFPARMLVPTSGGDAIYGPGGRASGSSGARRAGPLPRMVAVQAAGCDPIVRGWRAGATEVLLHPIRGRSRCRSRTRPAGRVASGAGRVRRRRPGGTGRCDRGCDAPARGAGDRRRAVLGGLGGGRAHARVEGRAGVRRGRRLRPDRGGREMAGRSSSTPSRRGSPTRVSATVRVDRGDRSGRRKGSG